MNLDVEDRPEIGANGTSKYIQYFTKVEQAVNYETVKVDDVSQPSASTRVRKWDRLWLEFPNLFNGQLRSVKT